jgi:hypothetical protein
MDADDTEMAIDHHADHDEAGALSYALVCLPNRTAPATPTHLGSAAVKTAPQFWPTAIIPSRLSMTLRTSAGPSPRRAPVAEDFVVTP